MFCKSLLLFSLSLSFVFGDSSKASLRQWNARVFHRVDEGEPKYVCGGTIIGRRFVITTGSCVESLDVGEIFIRGGERQVTVEKILKHPKDDLALLKTVEDLNVQSLTYWSASGAEEQIVGKRAVVDKNNSEDYAEFSVVSRRNCRNSDAGFYTKHLVEKKKFCAKRINGSLDLAFSGGEGLFIADKDGNWNLRGIVSSVQAKTNDYILLIDLTPYLQWIRELTGDTSIASSNSFECGQQSSTDEGRPWPWQGQIYRNDSGSIKRLCTVAIISDRFLISPAGVYSPSELRDPSQLALTFTSHDGDKSKVFHSQRIGKIIRHEKFYPESGANNIALLQLQTPLKFSERLNPICLWRSDPRELNVELTKAGTGIFTPVDNCDGPQNTFCIETGAPIAWNDTFYTEKSGSWYLKGITTNVTIDENGSRAVLLDVPRYTDWIDENSVFRRKNLLGNLHCAKRFINDYTFISDANGERCFAARIKPATLLTTATCLENVTASEM